MALASRLASRLATGAPGRGHWPRHEETAMSSKRGSEVVVVTGASGGVGRAIAHAFGKRGAHVALLARGERGLEDCRREVEQLGGRALPIPTDVADPEQLEAAAVQVEER